MTNSLFTQFYHLRGSRIAKDLNPEISICGAALFPVREADLFGVDTDPTLVRWNMVELRENDPKSLALQGVQQTQRE